MRQKILVAFDDSENAMRAVEQVATTYTPDNEITLYSVLPEIDYGCVMDLNSLNQEQLQLHYSLCSDMQKQRYYPAKKG
jgi:nucleotide-binding universal stress UspA family protein